MAFCLPPNLRNKFLAALKDGMIDVNKLADMPSSEARRSFLEGMVGDHAEGLNAEFESKMLQKDQQAGFLTWIKNAAGLTEPARRDLLSQIERLDRALNPADEKSFLADLVKKKLGVGVALDEVGRIRELGQTATAARDDIKANGWNMERGRSLGLAQMDLQDYIESLKPDGRGFYEKLADVLNVPRTILTLGHTSAPLVQGWGLISTKAGAEAVAKQFSWLTSETNYRNMMADIVGHPLYEASRKAGLAITDLGRKLSKREEAIQSTLVERFNQVISDQAAKVGIPLPNIARAGSRAFTGYLNYTRFNRFVDLVKAAEMRGEDVAPGSQAMKDLAEVVNNFSGRGSLGGGKLEQAAPILNSIFFAPRKIAGTVQMFNPLHYVDPRLSKTARIAAWRQMGGSIAATGAVIAIADAMGLHVSLDPTDTKFAKIPLGGGHFLDMTGGNAVYARLLARLVTGEMTTGAGKQMQLGQGFAPTRLGLAGQFLRGKLAPIPAALVDALSGKDAVGHAFSVTRELQDKLAPIAGQSFIHFLQAAGQDARALVFSPLILIGAGEEPPNTPVPADFGRYAPQVQSMMASAAWKSFTPEHQAAILTNYRHKLSALKTAQNKRAAAP